jgi:hypothetical protein
MVEKRHHDEPLPPGWSGGPEHAEPKTGDSDDLTTERES